MNSISIKITIITFFSFLLLSCKKDSIENTGSSNVTLSFTDESFDQTPSQKANASNLSTKADSVQTIITKTSNGLDLKATLTPITADEDEQFVIKKSSTSATKVQRQLQENTKLKVLVYNSSGTLFTDIDYTYKANGPKMVINDLLIGQSYTFIVYSINSTENIPEPQQKESLSSLQINDLTTQFLYFKEEKTIAPEANNTLNISLKHQFSEISSAITVDQTGDLAGSRVSQMTAPTISPAYQKAAFNLNTGVPIFQQSELIQNGKTLNLTANAITTNPITTSPVLLMTSGGSSTFNVNSITINNYTNTIKIENINLVPGVRYTLKLEVACPCLADVTQVNAISRTEYSSTASQFTYNTANYGAILDIFDIDNSFNLSVNETTVFEGTSQRIGTANQNFPIKRTNEIQFQGYNLYPNTELIPNIEFEDGSRWGRNNFGEIWHFKDATNTKPIIRIIVSKDGIIQMFGSKNLSGGEPFYPLRIVNNKNVSVTEVYNGSSTSNTVHKVNGKFNQVKWKANNNVIKLAQSRKDANDATSFRGSITGKRTVKCTP